MVGWVKHGSSVWMVRCANQSRSACRVVKGSTPCVTHHFAGGSLHAPTPVRVFRSFAKQPIFPKKRDLPAIIRQFLAYPHSNKSLYVSRNSKNHNSLAPLQGWVRGANRRRNGGLRTESNP